MTAETNNDRKQGRGRGLRARARSLAQLPGGRRAKFAVVGVWLVVALAIGPLSGKFEDAQQNRPVDYLPNSAESVEGDRSDRGLPIRRHRRRDHRLPPQGRADRRRPGGDRRGEGATNAERREGVGVTGPAKLQGRHHGAPDDADQGRGRQGDAGDVIEDTTKGIKASSTDLPAGLQAEVTGPAGFCADAIDVFNDINGTLLYATAALVLILLIVIYRSPIFWLIPFFAVVLAEVTSRGFGYLLAEAGVTVTGQSGGILPCSCSAPAPTTRC